MDATSGYQILSFLDAFSRYHQITMNVEEIPMNTFNIPKGMYAYIKMPFALKNGGNLSKNGEQGLRRSYKTIIIRQNIGSNR